MQKGKKSLGETHPELTKQWHPTKNGTLTPFDVAPQSNKKVWWKCDKGDEHEWEAYINNRYKGGGCPICHCLAILNPKLAKQWHPTKNGDLSPFKVSIGSNKKVWWKCDKGDDHEWRTSIDHRVKGTNCPMCSNRIVSKATCLASVNPKLAKQWHPTKNGDLTPYNILPSVNYKVWWKCEKGDDHEWQQSPNVRSRKTVSQKRGCPMCSGNKLVLSNCLATLNPELAKQWHPTKNENLTPFNTTLKSRKKVWWKCDKGDDHEWESTVYYRTNGSGCLICSGHKIVSSTSLATLNPELAKQWHPTKNGDLSPYDVGIGSITKVWWKCDKGEDHEWQVSPNSRYSSKGQCPICSNQKVVLSNCLATLNPELTKQWHPTKNGDLSPYDVGTGSAKKVWWKCDKGEDHEWKISTNNRSQGKSCPVCANLKVVLSNCLATTNPILAKQWHPTKNGDLTPYSVVEGSGKKRWWKCDKGDDHEWEASGDTRSKGIGCPFCTLTPQSKQELTITFELIQFFKEINPKGFKTRIDGKLWSIDIYIPELKLGIEFDGSYWHKDKRALDKLKTEQLEDDGFEIFRIREEPLKRIFDDDIMSKQPFNAKQLTNKILIQIMSRYNLDAKKVSKIESYIHKNDLQNEKELDRYIDKILTEKAENKSNKSNTAI